MPRRIASLDDLPPSVVLPISEACRCAINEDFRRMDGDSIFLGAIRTVVDAWVGVAGVVSNRFSRVYVVYERSYPEGGRGTTRWRCTYNMEGGRVGGNDPVMSRDSMIQPGHVHDPSAWYMHTGKADLDYENQP